VPSRREEIDTDGVPNRHPRGGHRPLISSPIAGGTAPTPARASVHGLPHDRRRNRGLAAEPLDGNVDDAVAAAHGAGVVEPVAEAMQVPRRADGEVGDRHADRRHRLPASAAAAAAADLDVDPARAGRKLDAHRLVPVRVPAAVGVLVDVRDGGRRPGLHNGVGAAAQRAAGAEADGLARDHSHLQARGGMRHRHRLERHATLAAASIDQQRWTRKKPS
jgi:hypothetical protein